jgi:hypothetical protein
VPPNEYALGHLINHGGSVGGGGEVSGPNVLAVMYDFPQDPLGWSGFPDHLRKYIPNKYAQPR